MLQSLNCCLPVPPPTHTESRSSAAYVTKPDNHISRVLKELLAQVPAALDQVAIASLGASLALAGMPQDTPGDAPSRLGERHKYIVELQVGRPRLVPIQKQAHIWAGPSTSLANPFLTFMLTVPPFQTQHNERVRKESKADMVNGHILALPFSDRCGREEPGEGSYVGAQETRVVVNAYNVLTLRGFLRLQSVPGIVTPYRRRSSTPASTRSRTSGSSTQ